MQKQIVVLFILLSFSVHAEEEQPSCMDQAQYLAVGLKLTEHLLYAVEHVNKGKLSGDEVCAQKFREKYYEADFVKFNQPLIQARIDLEERGVTSSKNFPYLRRDKVEMINERQVCEMVENHLKKNNRCMEPESYMRTLITKKIISRSFEDNCKKYIYDVAVNLGNCSTKK